jgi:hypothetical protein
LIIIKLITLATKTGHSIIINQFNIYSNFKKIYIKNSKMIDNSITKQSTFSIPLFVNFITLKQIGYDESNVGVGFYHDKTHFDSRQVNSYSQFTEELTLLQGRHFILHNRYGICCKNKIKDQINQLDTLLDRENNGKSIIKTIWLRPNRLILFLYDGMIVWLKIDESSGDVVQILIDSSLLDHLKGNLILCDVALDFKLKKQVKQSSKNQKIIHNEHPIFILTFSNSSQVKIISFQKSNQFHFYLTSGSDKSLKKMTQFEPFIMSFVFNCPKSFLIEKRIIQRFTPNSIHQRETFCLWWSNSISSNESVDMSLLEKEDFSNNILVMSMRNIESELNILEYKFKSDGHLLSVAYLNSSSLIAIEQVQLQNNDYKIIIFSYNLILDMTSIELNKNNDTIVENHQLISRLVEGESHGNSFSFFHFKI